MSNPERTKRKVISSIIAIVVLFSMLVLTTYALILSLVSVEDHLFETATVKIELNEGKPVFDGSDMNIEPGYTIVRDFTVENQSSVDVHIRLYLENVEGTLRDALMFSVYDGDKLLFQGRTADLNKSSPCKSSTPLTPGEIRKFTAVVKMEESAGNTFQTGGITFDMTADAVQAKNNPTQVFE